MESMKIAVMLACGLIAVGCATTGPVAGLEPGKLVQFECEGGKGFGARIEEDYSGVRVRTHEGSVNLARAENDEFKGDGWTLKTQGGMQLAHKDKVMKGCRRAS
ncbi:MAG: hypothetical protein SF172_14375 [Burkholderiales bacterium]|nr:hypothetical protein [Burkholderiales bacterium]